MYRKRVLFFHCGRYNDLTPHITMGLWGLADLADKLGYDAKIIHTRVEELKEGSFDVRKYIDEDVVFVGFSAHWFPMVKECLDLAADIRVAYPGLFICFGGYSASYFVQDIMERYEAVSAIIRGDGEQPLKELLSCIKEDVNDYSRVPNLVWRSADGRIITNEMTYVSTCEDVRGLQYARFDKYLYEYEFSKDVGYEFGNSKVEILSYHYDSFFDFRVSDFTVGKTFYLLTGKGCYANCLFCGGGFDAQKRLNHRSECMYLDEEQVIETVKDAQALGYESFYICFDPTPAKPHYFELLKKMANECSDISLLFGFWGLPTDEVLDRFQEVTGKLIFELSPETDNEEIRKKVRGYSFTNHDMYRIIDECYKRKIYTHIYFSYPLPYETEKDIRKDREAAMRLNTRYPHYIEAFYLGLSTDPASPLYNEPAKYGCELTVFSFEDHLRYCSGINYGGNILVHRNRNIGPDNIEIRRIAYDHKVKSMLSYDLKLLGMAFETTGELLDYLDGFYEKLELYESSNKIIGYDEVMDLLVSYNESVSGQAEWLEDMLRLIATEKYLKKLPPRQNTYRTDPNGSLLLTSLSRLLVNHYNVHEVRSKLWQGKEFSQCEKREEGIMLLALRNETVELYELNESLYLLMKEFEKPCTMKVACQNVACMYSDEEAEITAIENDMKAVAESLIAQGILVNGIN